MKLKNTFVPFVTAVTFLLAASPAQAGLVVQTANPVQRAVQIADAYWGYSETTPVVYASQPTGPVNAGPDAAAIAAGEAFIQAWASTSDPTHTIYLNNVIWTPEEEVARFQAFCDVITHEVGHFLGHIDAGQTDPTSINYPTIGEKSPNYNAVPGCIGVKLRTETWVITPQEKTLEEAEEKEAEHVMHLHHHRKHTKHHH